MTKRGAIDKKGRAPSPKLLTRYRVASLLEILDVGLADTETRIRHALEHAQTHDTAISTRPGQQRSMRPRSCALATSPTPPTLSRTRPC